jgi:preprotein translocase subunit SecG
MELEKMKTAWTSVDKRLKKQEVLNTRIVTEMLQNKSSRALSRLINFEASTAIVLLAAIPLCVWWMNVRGADTFFPKITMIAGIIICVIGLVLTYYALRNYLTKIDFSGNIKDNMQYVNKYGIFYRKMKMAGYFVIFPVISLLLILSYYEFKVPAHLWITLTVGLLLTIGVAIWIYKAIYDKNIQTIKESLAELSELEEE